MKKFLFLPLLFLCSLMSAQDCIDESQINPDAICPFIYAPVCGCDAMTYSNSCMADAAGVTQYVNGPCGIAPPCADLTGVDFGLCLAVLGIGFQNGSCQTISGCGYIVNDVDYTSYFYETTDQCEMACGEAVVECDDLAGIDFGFCDFPLGICNINGTCTMLSGCDWVVDEVDYSPFFFENMDDCTACVGDNDCEDLADVDFGDCEMIMGIAYADGECQWISGCGFIVNEVDYSPYFFEDEAECAASCGGEQGCEDLANVDFGDCEMVMGIAYVEGECQLISGCGFIVNEIDYSPFF
ncbi:MAG: Kazal-type serine protease inhibitor family protein, partial [Flavobacteriales bacterium]